MYNKKYIVYFFNIVKELFLHHRLPNNIIYAPLTHEKLFEEDGKIMNLSKIRLSIELTFNWLMYIKIAKLVYTLLNIS